MRSELGVMFLPLAIACSSTAEPASGSAPTAPAAPAPAAPTSGVAGSPGSSPLIRVTPPVVTTSDTTRDLGAPCDSTRAVDESGASLVVRDPVVLARFSLQRVLAQIVQTLPSGTAQITPLELLQRLFDTENGTANAVFADNVHCDSAVNTAFLASGHAAIDCPRAEGALAHSAVLLDEKSPDSFVPVALVSRFDLIPTTRATCGEFRIVYAKQSGRTDPDDRVMLIFEGALTNPDGTLRACRPVAEFWAGVPAVGAGEPLASAMDAFYFQGLPGLNPAVHANHYGFGAGRCSYSGGCGQIRLGQGMHAPFEFRQFQVSLVRDQAPYLPAFTPMLLTSTPRPELFDLSGGSNEQVGMQAEIIGELSSLIDADVTRLHAGRQAGFDAGESAVAGLAAPNFAARIAASSGNADFLAALAKGLATEPLPVCPAGDPLTTDSIIARTAALTCAGCHAPEQVLPNGLHTGCGQQWPKTHSPTHIDENGNLSPALLDVFLPRRADFLATYLRACDPDAVIASLQPVQDLSILR